MVWGHCNVRLVQDLMEHRSRLLQIKNDLGHNRETLRVSDELVDALISERGNDHHAPVELFESFIGGGREQPQRTTE